MSTIFVPETAVMSTILVPETVVVRKVEPAGLIGQVRGRFNHLIWDVNLIQQAIEVQDKHSYNTDIVDMHTFRTTIFSMLEVVESHIEHIKSLYNNYCMALPKRSY